MSKRFTFLLLFTVHTFSLTTYAQKEDSLKAVEILEQFEQRIRSAKNLTYHSSMRSVNSGLDDSVFTAEGTVWMALKPTDTIFGNVFHLKGENKSGAYDYYYDGQKGFEIRHKDKEILVFDPYAFPNNENNPAKARTALGPARTLLSKKDIIRYLLTDYPYADDPVVKLKTLPTEWIITMEYPENKYGAIATLVVHIQKDSYQLLKTKRVIYWHGTVSTETYLFDDIRMDNNAIQDSILLKSSYNSYVLKEYRRPVTKQEEVRPMTGKKAPDFRYTTFDNKAVSLKEMKGKYVLLDFWETWCGYCILALPKMKEVYEKYHHKGLEIIGVTTENEKRIAEIISFNKLPYIHVKGDSSIINNYKIEGRPGYVLIDKEGKIIEYNNWEKIEKFLEGL